MDHLQHATSFLHRSTGRHGPRRLRILQVASEAPPIRSGIARSIEQLRDGLQRRGHCVDVVAHPGVSRVSVGEMRLYGLIFELRQLTRWIRGYDIIHLHGSAPSFSDIFLIFAHLLRGRPLLVYTHHCDIHFGPVGLLNAVYNALHHRLSASADAVISTSSDCAAELGVAGEVSVIPLGVDPARFATTLPKDPQLTVLFVGQFRPYKGVPVLLRALAQVPGVRLLLAGQGPEEQLYRGLAAQLGLDVEFHINPDDSALRGLYARAHVIVLPSVTRAEAFGLVLLEGMAAGCVPVASDLPGVREVLGRIGFTFPSGKAEALGLVLRELRDRPDLVERVAARSRKRAMAFTWDRNVAEYERLFLDLLAAREVTAEVGFWTDPAHAIEIFVSHVGRRLATPEVAVFLGAPGADLRMAGTQLALDAVLQHQMLLLARYSRDSGESAIVTPDRAPKPLLASLPSRAASLVAAPLDAHGRRFGAVVATRISAFDDGDLRSLVRLARQAAALNAGPTKPPSSLQVGTFQGPGAPVPESERALANHASLDGDGQELRTESLARACSFGLN